MTVIVEAHAWLAFEREGEGPHHGVRLGFDCGLSGWFAMIWVQGVEWWR